MEEALVPVEVTVPEGIWAGDQFTVDSPFGGSYDIICPDGCGPGMAIVVICRQQDS